MIFLKKVPFLRAAFLRASHISLGLSYHIIFAFGIIVSMGQLEHVFINKYYTWLFCPYGMGSVLAMSKGGVDITIGLKKARTGLKKAIKSTIALHMKS